MAIVSPPEAPAEGPVVEPPISPSPPYPPAPPDSAVSRPQRRGVAGGLILIALGVIALLGLWFPSDGGAWLFLGLGAAFLIARVVTGHAGYAVPAGILLGFGSFVWFTDAGVLVGPAAGGSFFIFLGLGFVASYLIAARPAAVWPVVPGLVLIGFGVVIQTAMMGVPMGQFWWLAQYWPIAVVAVGVWLLARDRMPEAARTPVAIVGGTALVLIGLLVAAAGMSSVASGYAGMPMPMFRTVPGFGAPTFQDSLVLTAPATSINAVQVANTSGQTSVRRGTASEIRVQATRHFWNADSAPDVRLVPSDGVLTIAPVPASSGASLMNTYVDYTIEVPAGVGADIRSASGDIDVRGIDGALSAVSTSGAIRASDVAGDVQLRSTSGAISATGVDRLTRAQSTSGRINLNGAFAEAAQISSMSGEITVRFAPSASVRVDASSVSGDVTGDLGLTRRTTGSHSLAGVLGQGGSTMSIHTTSGGIRLLSGQ
jgi:putative adhesin